MSSESGAVEEHKDGKRNKICDFYLTPKGCVKGDKCDFQHPLTPSGAANNRVCEFFQTPRGCRKGDQCDFLHPAGSKAAVKSIVCNYYMNPAGCIKGMNCDFLHPRPGVFGDASGGVAGYPRGAPAAGGARSPRPCDYFFSQRGCIKGEACDFSHARPGAAPYGAEYGAIPAAVPGYGYPYSVPGYGPPPPSRAVRPPVKPKPCEFFSTSRGCVKGEMCDFIHQKQRPCEFFDKPQGCRKGATCDFQHLKDGEALPAEGEAGKARSSRFGAGRGDKSRYAPY